MRRCPKCARDLPICMFGVARRRRDGISCWCKECNREKSARIRATPLGAANHRRREMARYAANPDSAKEKGRKRHAANREINNAKCRERGARLRASPEFRLKAKLRGAEWYRNNPARGVAKVRKRQMLRAAARPLWLTAIHLALIDEYYELAAARSVQTGIKHHVDHVVSLNGDGFNGLDVPWNLQVISGSENDSKGNKIPVGEEHYFWSAT